MFHPVSVLEKLPLHQMARLTAGRCPRLRRNAQSQNRLPRASNGRWKKRLLEFGGDLLRVEKGDCTTTLFDLGGNSLLVVQERRSCPEN